MQHPLLSRLQLDFGASRTYHADCILLLGNRHDRQRRTNLHEDAASDVDLHYRVGRTNSVAIGLLGADREAALDSRAAKAAKQHVHVAARGSHCLQCA